VEGPERRSLRHENAFSPLEAELEPFAPEEVHTGMLKHRFVRSSSQNFGLEQVSILISEAPMSHVFVDVKFTNQPGEREVEANVMVDTGAIYTVIPRAMADELRLPVEGKRRVRTANGSVELESSWLFVALLVLRGPTYVLVGEQLDRALIGVITLEEFGLQIDPSSGELKATDAFLY
jgi:aspartyl protease family protein